MSDSVKQYFENEENLEVPQYEQQDSSPDLSQFIDLVSNVIHQGLKAMYYDGYKDVYKKQNLDTIFMLLRNKVESRQ